MTLHSASGTGSEAAALFAKMKAVNAPAHPLLATAESLTGGLLADALVAIPGASEFFAGGVIAYDTRAKTELLGVDAALLARTGPVTAEVARAMAAGVAERFAAFVCADVMGLATTGVAGPAADAQTGQTPGTVFVGCHYKGYGWARKLVFAGDREAVRKASCRQALRLALECLGKVV